MAAGNSTKGKMIGIYSLSILEKPLKFYSGNITFKYAYFNQ